MSDILMDTCSIINLERAGALPHVLTLDQHDFFIGQEVLEECRGRCDGLNLAIAAGRIAVLDDSTLPATRFVELLELHGLGNGETECLVYAELKPTAIICSDDRAARNVAVNLFGLNRVLGSIRLLRQCVDGAYLTEEAAFLLYQEMRKRGAFLPDMNRAQFATA